MIRRARRSDVPAIYQLIRDLAEYERLLHEVTASEADVDESLFGPEPRVFAHVADDEGTVVGFALWFLNYSTFLGRHGIYLEDIYVRPAARGRGYGKRLLAELAALCADRGYGRLEWSALDWNSPARGFYAALGAELMDSWTVHRLSGRALRALAASKTD